jgi:hypothetical protein
MAVASNPLNTAEFDLEYATDGTGSSYTPFGSEVIDVQPDEFMRKVLERRLLNGTRVQKITGRIDYGNLKVTLEYSSATFAIVLGWQTTKTRVWIRSSAEDTGGTSDSKLVYKGYVSGVTPPATPGDDAVAQFSFTLACDDFAWTAAS